MSDPASPPGAPTRQWTDSDAVDPAWAAPSASLSGRRRSPRFVAGIIVLALVLAVGLVWALGGFADRTDILLPRDPGTQVSSGPYDFVFTKATAQQKKGFDGTVYWEVFVLGTVANTSTTAMFPPYGDMFVAKDPGSGEVHSPEIAKIGDGTYIEHSTVTPGLPPVAYRVEFHYGATYRPGPTLAFVAFQLEYTDEDRTGDDKTWNDANRAYRFSLPVEVLPTAPY